jgi:hypothetical protein
MGNDMELFVELLEKNMTPWQFEVKNGHKMKNKKVMRCNENITSIYNMYLKGRLNLRELKQKNLLWTRRHLG